MVHHCRNLDSDNTCDPQRVLGAAHQGPGGGDQGRNEQDHHRVRARVGHRDRTRRCVLHITSPSAPSKWSLPPHSHACTHSHVIYFSCISWFSSTRCTLSHSPFPSYARGCTGDPLLHQVLDSQDVRRGHRCPGALLPLHLFPPSFPLPCPCFISRSTNSPSSLLLRQAPFFKKTHA
jgi:hypothetical protein